MGYRPREKEPTNQTKLIKGILKALRLHSLSVRHVLLFPKYPAISLSLCRFPLSEAWYPRLDFPGYVIFIIFESVDV